MIVQIYWMTTDTMETMLSALTDSSTWKQCSVPWLIPVHGNNAQCLDWFQYMETMLSALTDSSTWKQCSVPWLIPVHGNNAQCLDWFQYMETMLSALTDSSTWKQCSVPWLSALTDYSTWKQCSVPWLIPVHGNNAQCLDWFQYMETMLSALIDSSTWKQCSVPWLIPVLEDRKIRLLDRNDMNTGITYNVNILCIHYCLVKLLQRFISSNCIPFFLQIILKWKVSTALLTPC